MRKDQKKRKLFKKKRIENIVDWKVEAFGCKPNHKTGIKTYFPTPNSNLYLPSFISPPEVYSNPFNSSQTYQYQPIYYNSVNICANNQTSVRLSNNNNNNNFCGYCLPTSTTANSQSSQDIVAAQQELLQPLITGNSAQVEPALILNHFTEVNLSDSLKHQSVINHFNNNNLSEITTANINNIGDNFHKDIMVSKGFIFTNRWA